MLIGLGPFEFAALAARTMTPKAPPVVSLDHIHAPTVSVREQAGILVDRLRRNQVATFRSLTADCGATVEVVARFLALLELFREGVVHFEQVSPLGELYVRWSGSDEDEQALGEGVGAEFDEQDGGTDGSTQREPGSALPSIGQDG